MYWADQASSGRGQWWEGTVLGYVKRALDDPFRDSPWAAVIIRWSETDSKDNISPWELSQPEDGFRQAPQRMKRRVSASLRFYHIALHERHSCNKYSMTRELLGCLRFLKQSRMPHLSMHAGI